MVGYHNAGVGGGVQQWRQEFAHLDLPPGKYLVFGKVQIAIGSAASDPLGTAYQAILEVGGVKDEVIGSLRYDTDDPGSRFEAIALNVAAENNSPLRASLLINATDSDRLYVWEPRLSAIQLEELHVTAERNERGAIGQQRMDIDLLTTLAAAGEQRVAT